MPMHAGQVVLTEDIVAELVATQFPQWCGRRLRRVDSDGTVNALFRLGDDLVLRFPLVPDLSAEHRSALIAEQDNARRLAGQVPLEVPIPVALGAPGAGYPGPWTVFEWLAGESVQVAKLGDGVALARSLAGFVRALQSIDTGGRHWDGTGRGGPLADLDDAVQAALQASAGLLDTAALAGEWERCRDAPRPDRHDGWIHADLMPGNLLLRDGLLAAVLDLGAMTIGDPAVDLMPAWNLLPAEGRAAYRQALGADDASWARGQGWAIAQAIVALPYYRHSNTAMADTARHTIAAMLSA